MRAITLAVLAHAVLVVALTWGVNWKSSSDQPAVEAELWAAVPQQAAPRAAEPPPPPAPEPTPEPQPAPAPPPPPPPAPRQAEPDTRDADIALQKQKKREEELKKKREQELEQDKKDKERRERLEQEKKERQLAQKKAEREKAEREKAARKTAGRAKKPSSKRPSRKSRRNWPRTSAARPRKRARPGGRCAPPGEHPPHAGPGRCHRWRDGHRHRIAQRRPLGRLRRQGGGQGQAQHRLPGQVAATRAPRSRYSRRARRHHIKARITQSSGNKAWDEPCSAPCSDRDPAARHRWPRAIVAGDRLSAQD
jgi:colicin import membrane protein